MIRSPVPLIVAGLFLVSFAAPANSRPLRRDTYSVRVEGYVGGKPENAPIEVSWTVSVKGERYQLFVTKLQVLTGSATYYDIINALKPYRTALTINGDDRQIDMFATAPAGQKLSVIGYLRFDGAARYLMISKVDYVGKPAAVQATPAVASNGAATR